MKTEKRRVGDIGEKIVSMYLIRRGFSIIDTNYSKPWGEIDIIAKKDRIIHFIEVKTVRAGLAVTHETSLYRPEDNVHAAKLKRIARTMQTYLVENQIEGEWAFDVAAVTLDRSQNKARVRFLENIVL